MEIHLWNLRDWAKGKHKSVDDRPFGGGPGMVIMPEPVFAAVEEVGQKAGEPGLLVLLTPTATVPIRFPSGPAIINYHSGGDVHGVHGLGLHSLYICSKINVLLYSYTSFFPYAIDRGKTLDTVDSNTDPPCGITTCVVHGSKKPWTNRGHYGQEE